MAMTMKRLAASRHWIDTHPAQTTRERVVLVYAWTEIGEGGAIIPSRADGYAYADAVRTVFGGPGRRPRRRHSAHEQSITEAL
jgi:hypothetical protein